VVEEAVARAMYCFSRSPDGYHRTVLTAANAPGDSDSIVCIAGAISDAHNGIGAIPQNWRKNVENALMLEQLSLDLCEMVCL